MLIGVRQRGQPCPWLCTLLAFMKHWQPHSTSAMHVLRGATRHTLQKSTAASADTVVGVPASSLVSSSFWCCILSSRASVSSSSSTSEWLSLSISSEPTAWLTARRNCSRVYAWLSNLCKHMFTCFLARLMARLRVTLLTSDTLSMVICCRCPRNANKLGCETSICQRRPAWKLSTVLLVLDGLSRTESRWTDGGLVEPLSVYVSEQLLHRRLRWRLDV